jgi:TonB family protein
LFLLGAVLLTSIDVRAQDAPKTTADEMPTFPGCETGDMVCARQKMTEFVRERIRMPEAASEAKEGGVAMVAFVIGKNGKISDVKLKSDPGFGMGAEALRVVNLMIEEKVKWEPGREDGKKVDIQMVLPVSFNSALPEKKADAETETDADKVYTAAEVMPRFSGCADASEEEAKDCTFNKLIAYLRENLKYPEEAKEEKTEGMVMTSFVINEEGKAEDVKILKPVSEALDDEAERVILAMPAWSPGQQDGKNVKVMMTLPVQFKLRTPADPPKDGNN